MLLTVTGFVYQVHLDHQWLSHTIDSFVGYLNTLPCGLVVLSQYLKTVNCQHEGLHQICSCSLGPARTMFGLWFVSLGMKRI